ncbi:MAG TPA: SagB/ThcOx family dehydrogenase [Nitrospiria bacterium]|nr:SagB/ThcOx family dehydrogenase [Nitrospiria bacterium]
MDKQRVSSLCCLSMAAPELDLVLAYHKATKHHLNRYARGPGGLDWANQPDPFRRYAGAPLIQLDHIPAGERPLYEEVFLHGRLPIRPLERSSLSQLFYDSLALSAWKQAGGVRWSLRVNPSSGNLHPTEGYLICGPIAGLCDTPMICHYAPQIHALEQRTEVSLEVWRTLTAGVPEGTILIGLTSIHWREAWKYGERAFRYCQHDAGHAIAAVTLAASALGWTAMLLDDLSTDSIAALLGLDNPDSADGPEPEEPECLLAVYPQGTTCKSRSLPAELIESFKRLHRLGTANQLSLESVDWPIIEQVADATRKSATNGYGDGQRPTGPTLPVGSAPISFRSIVHQRRSCLALDGKTGLTREAFYQILRKTIPGPGQFPFTVLSWPPMIHFGLFVHRIEGIDPGLYCLVRDPSKLQPLRSAMKQEFAWEVPPGSPGELLLFRLLTGDARELAQQISCHQEIAADGCFSLGMIAEYEAPLSRYGAWFYRRLFWEAGLIGQVLYLEAEASGIRGTGIGCYFDDPMHQVLGLDDRRFQDLYHFTMGGPVEDTRLTTLPAYSVPLT